jgi:hypothetical protein
MGSINLFFVAKELYFIVCNGPGTHQTTRRWKVKRIILALLAAALFLGIGIQNASAENSLRRGTIGLGIDTSSDFFIRGKYLLESDVALTGGFGLGFNGGDSSGTDIAIGAGVRKYLRVTDFAPFIGGFAQVSSLNDPDIEKFAILAEAGAEYFLARQFSLEGTVRFGYTTEDRKNVGKKNYFGTDRASIGFNFYF